VRPIKHIITDARVYDVSPASQHYTSYQSIERFEKPGEMAMVGWFRVVGWYGELLEVQEKFVVEVEYEPEPTEEQKNAF
jgi:hypothetical protein